MDYDTQKLIEQIIDGKVQARAMFTAFDITLEAKEQGFTGRHADVKELVHQTFQTGGMGIAYIRELIDIVGAPVQPFLYMPRWEDKANYKPKDRSKVAVVTAAPAPAQPTPKTALSVTYKFHNPIAPTPGNVTLGTIAKAFGATVDSSNAGTSVATKTVAGPVVADPDDDITYCVDKRNRVCIPKRFTQGLGLTHGDAAYLLSTFNALTITAKTPAYNANYRVYMVDKSGNIRIEQKVLAGAGIGGKMYQIDGDNNSVTVKPV